MTPRSEDRGVLILVQNLSVPFDRRVWLESLTLHRSGRDVDVICPKSGLDRKRFEVIEGVRIHRFPLPFQGKGAVALVLEYIWSLSWMAVMTAAITLRHRPAVVHICNPPDLLFLPALVARLRNGTRMVFDQHDLCPEVWEAKGHGRSRLAMKALRACERITYRTADHVISTNLSYKDTAETRGSKRASEVTIVRSAPERSFAVPGTRNAREAGSGGRLVYLGTMGEQEGIDLLIQAIPVLRDRFGKVDIEVDLVGDGPERKSLSQMTSDLGLSGSFRFHGRLPDAEMRDVLISGDIAINPDRPSTLNSLSSMNKIVEYMALGLPIIQFDGIEGRRTALEASKYVAEPTPDALAQEISSLLDDQAERQRMADFGLRRFLDELCWEKQAPELIRAYDELSARPGPISD